MTKINWCDGRLLLSGHAPRAEGEEGNLVCAAISMMVFALADALPDTCAARLDEGDAEFVFCPEDARAMAMRDMAIAGFRMLAARYPDRVEVHICD